MRWQQQGEHDHRLSFGAHYQWVSAPCRRKYGLTEEEITGLGRWTMIDMASWCAA